MDGTQTLKLQMFLRVDTFCQVEHAAEFAAGTHGLELVQLLHAIIGDLNEQISVQAAETNMAQAMTDTKEAARQALHADLKRIRRTAQGLEQRKPGVAAQFKLRKHTDDALIAAGHAFLTNGDPLKAEFIKSDLPADFLTQLQTNLNAFAQARTGQDMHLSRQVAATSNLHNLIKRGVAAVRQLDPIVRNKFSVDQSIIAAWASASHIERSPTKTPEPPPQPSPQP
jgi:hypothetical protein